MRVKKISWLVVAGILILIIASILFLVLDPFDSNSSEEGTTAEASPAQETRPAGNTVVTSNPTTEPGAGGSVDGGGNREPDDTPIHTSMPAPTSVPTIIDSGYCGGEGDGTNLTWTLDSEGTLTIAGTGEMATYIDGDSTWDSSHGSISKVNIEDGVTSIGNDAFSSCDNLTSVKIPSSVMHIGNYAFWNCINLTSIEIPDSVTSIGERAFCVCWNLTNITVDVGNPAYSSDSDGVLFNKDKTELIQYPIGNSRTAYSIPSSVTSVKDYAFHNCNSLTSLEIPSSMASIGESAFGICCHLSNITVDVGNPAYSSGSDGVLFNKDKTELILCPIGNPRTAYSIPSGVTSIQSYAFGYCVSLTSIEIPDSVTFIGVFAFNDCDSLTDVYYLGSEAQWQEIENDSSDNGGLLNATIHFGEKMSA